MKPDPLKQASIPPRYRKINILLIVLVIVLLLVIGFMAFWPSLRGLAIPPPPPERGLPPRPEKLRVVKGVVTGFKYNTHIDYNSIQLKTSQAGLITIDFRPHTARAVMDVARLNDTIEVEYTLNPNDEAVGYQLHIIRDSANNKSINVDQLPPPPRVPPNQSPETFAVKNPQLITDEYGGIAAIKSGNLLFHFKPGQVDDISSQIKNCHQLSILAVSRDRYSGFVNAEHDQVYIVISITINNQTFLIR